MTSFVTVAMATDLLTRCCLRSMLEVFNLPDIDADDGVDTYTIKANVEIGDSLLLCAELTSFISIV